MVKRSSRRAERFESAALGSSVVVKHVYTKKSESIGHNDKIGLRGRCVAIVGGAIKGEMKVSGERSCSHRFFGGGTLFVRFLRAVRRASKAVAGMKETKSVRLFTG